jgi:hypothetical protein
MGMYKEWWEWTRNGAGMDPEWMRTKQDHTRTPGNSRNGQGILQEWWGSVRFWFFALDVKAGFIHAASVPTKIPVFGRFNNTRETRTLK